MPNIATAKTRVDKMLAELEGRRQWIGEDLEEPLNPDFSERAVEVEDDASLEGQAALLVQEIASVKRALARIDNINCARGA